MTKKQAEKTRKRCDAIKLQPCWWNESEFEEYAFEDLTSALDMLERAAEAFEAVSSCAPLMSDWEKMDRWLKEWRAEE